MNDASVSPTFESSRLPYLAPERCLISDFKVENHDTVTLTLKVPDGYGPWKPGQFNMIYVFGIGEVPLSISGSTSNSSYVSHTIKIVGPVTQALTKLAKDDSIWVRGPYGTSWPNTLKNEDVLLIAGGIGLAPLRPVMLAALTKKTNRRTILIYGTRTPDDILFSDDLSAWGREPNVSVHVTVDRIEKSTPDLPWTGSVGVVTHLLHHLHLEPSTTTVMTCGPEVMMRHVASDLDAQGITNEQIFVSLERNMKCAIGLCGRCQWGAHFVCHDGPVYRLADIRRFWSVQDF